MDTYPPTSRTQVRRLPKRAAYDKEQVHAILDEGYICHVGFVIDDQFVIGYGMDDAGRHRGLPYIGMAL